MLRIEDTDRERSTPENVEQILDALRWLELDWDEGPIFQTRASRAPRARRCSSCSTPATPTTPTPPATTSRPASSSTATHAASAARPRRPARSACACPTRARPSSTTSSAARRASPHTHLDDPVIARADGSVLYNFAVAIDDLDAGITHVVRGEDHLSNTPKQLLVFEALGRDAAALRAPAAAARPRRQEALQAPRRRLRAGAARRRLPARGGAQLHRAARRRLRRRGGVLPDRRARAPAAAGAHLEVAGRLRRAEAAPHERPLPARPARSTS